MVYSTTFVNLFACILLLLKLNNKLDNLKLSKIISQNLRIFLIGLISGISSFFIFKIIYVPYTFFNLLFKILISSGISLVIFYCLAIFLKVDDIDSLNKYLKEKFIPL